jgi:Actinobacteria/chloroflexi VLRF1 release factor
VANDAGDGARWIEVAPERLAGWLESFAGRHGGASPAWPAPGAAAAAGVSVVTVQAADGAVAQCHVPFPPLLDQAPPDPAPPDPAPPGAELAAAAARIAAHACADRTVGVLLVRLGGYAAGVFTGQPPRLAASKVGSRLVHGRSAAGGTSQHRFARRREKQASEALGAAADTAAAVFAPYARQLDAVVLGGDRRAIAGLRDDPRLSAYFALAAERFLTVPDPRLVVLRGTPRLFRAVRIRLTEPAT